MKNIYLNIISIYLYINYMDRCEINRYYIDCIIKSYVYDLYCDSNLRVNMEYFNEAMLHDSTKCQIDDKTYNRLEYLGDSIFHMIITEYLYYRYDEENEG